MYRVLKPPASLDSVDRPRTVFLAGSIEMGKAEDWQSYIAQSLQDTNAIILNPRRDDWDSTWEQTISNPQFREQVEWELSAQELATAIAMYFDPSTKSPITLLELGLFAGSGKVIVCCPDGFWRKGNVDLVCARYRIPMVNTLDDLAGKIRAQLTVSPSSASEQ